MGQQNNQADMMEQIRNLLDQNQGQTNEERHYVNMGRVQTQYSSEAQNDPNLIGKTHSLCFNTSIKNTTTWIIDSGATDHMCGSNITLTDQRNLTKPIVVHLPNS